MKHILAAVDLNPTSEWAFARAVQIAVASDADLTAVHVIDRRNAEAAVADDALAAQAEARLAHLWADLPRPLAGRFRHLIRAGTPATAIVNTAAEIGASLIVLGRHAVRPMVDAFLGTTASHIIRASAMPVLMVRDKPAGAYRKVMVGTDFSPNSSRALQAALKLAPGADFIVVNVFQTPFPGFIRMSEEEIEAMKQEHMEEARRQVSEDLARFLDDHSGPNRPNVASLCERGDPINGLAQMVQRHQPELIAIGTQSKDATPGAKLGSVAVAFLNDPPCDVLVSH
jgi:nucleotide-binding universal stress UspA family protein